MTLLKIRILSIHSIADQKRLYCKMVYGLATPFLLLAICRFEKKSLTENNTINREDVNHMKLKYKWRNTANALKNILLQLYFSRVFGSFLLRKNNARRVAWFQTHEKTA